jgi:hypothetical protein
MKTTILVRTEPSVIKPPRYFFIKQATSTIVRIRL